MTKARVGLRLKEALHVTKAQSRSADLEPLAERYNLFSKKLKDLISLLENQRASVLKYNYDRLKVAGQLCDMSAGTPISEIVGEAESVTEKSTKQSFTDLHKALATKTDEAATKFATDVIDQVTDWEKTIASHILDHQTQSEKLRRELDHYERKVEGLHANVAEMEAKEKMVSSSLFEKKERNDEKFARAKTEYETYTHELCEYMEEVTERAWKDIIPVIIALTKWETETAFVQAGFLDKMTNLIQNLLEISDESGFDGETFRITALKKDASTTLQSPEDKSSDKPSPKDDIATGFLSSEYKSPENPSPEDDIATTGLLARLRSRLLFLENKSPEKTEKVSSQQDKLTGSDAGPEEEFKLATSF